MICDRCGCDNPSHLIFCQDCGRRLQDPPRRVVEPTPPAGLPAKGVFEETSASPGASPRSDGFGGAVVSPAAMSDRSPPIVCSRCQTRNPSMGKFCVSCGASLLEGAGGPSAVAPAIQVAEPIPVVPVDRGNEALRPAAVVNIASERSRAATITCDRCQGICEAGMRFCKFCGAPLPQTDSARTQQSPAVQDRSVEYGKAATRQGLQAAIEEAARQTSAFSPKPIAQPVAVDPTSRGDEPPRRGRTDPSAAVEVARREASQPTDAPKAPPTEGLYVPFSAKGQPVAGRVIVVAGDGQEGPSFPLVGEQMDIGRSEGSVVLSEDRYMSPRHARLVRIKGRWYVRDLGSTNGVFVRISKQQELVDSDCLLLGVEVLRFEMLQDSELGLGAAVQHGTLVFGSPALPRPARLVQRTVEGVARDVYHLHRLETVIGRESGDIVFTDDPYLSRRHALIRRDSSTGRFSLIDLDSSNGTFVAIRGDCPVNHGDSIRVGQHLFRIELAQG